jgi:putative two-component system response regulator
LAGNAIPLSARIMTLADVYDALTSRRVYKEPFSHQTARVAIVEEPGSHFDPVVVDAFLANEQEFIAIRDQYAESEEKIVAKEEMVRNWQQSNVLQEALAWAVGARLAPKPREE